MAVHDSAKMWQTCRRMHSCALHHALVQGLQIDTAFKAAIETEAVRQRIQERLVQERARMESEVEAKIAEERRIQLLRKRKEQEQRLRDQVRPQHLTLPHQQALTAPAASDRWRSSGGLNGACGRKCTPDQSPHCWSMAGTWNPREHPPASDPLLHRPERRVWWRGAAMRCLGLRRVCYAPPWGLCAAGDRGRAHARVVCRWGRCCASGAAGCADTAMAGRRRSWSASLRRTRRSSSRPRRSRQMRRRSPWRPPRCRT